jgi:hypothetical protein
MGSFSGKQKGNAMSMEPSGYVVDEANEKRLKSWLNAGQWTREEATYLFLDINPRSVTSECFSTFGGRGQVQYDYYDAERKVKEPCSYDDGEPVYLTAEQDALFHKTMSRRVEIDLQLNILEAGEPREWIELARKKGITVPWLDSAINSGLHGQKTEPDAVAAPVADESVSEQIPWDLLATPAQLIAVFGLFTGMNKAWFNALKYKPKLKAARYKAGVGGRGGTKPLFYGFPVMQWLIDPKNKVDSEMTELTGWRMLKAHFPEVYKHYEDRAPDPD